MEKEDIIEVTAKDDAKWDESFVGLNDIGIASNKKFSTCDPPEEPEEKAVYDKAWNDAKKKQ